MTADISEPLQSQLLDLARRAERLSQPNPRVACVITTPDGRVLGSGHTQAAGQAHAEVMALADARAQGHDVHGATAWVTLEPCSHQGRTGPCCDALIAAGIARVVAACTDPNPLVSGQGLARLQAAGVQVDLLPEEHALAQASRDLNIGFFSRMVRKTPWVRMKVAASLDGITALPNGRSQWITSPQARSDGHAWRARASAVLTGIGTVLQDRPRLDVRLVDTPRQPDLVIVDSRLETPPESPVFIEGRKLLIYCAVEDAERAEPLLERGAHVICLPGSTEGQPTGKVDLSAMLHDLAQREVNELHVEAGHQLNGSFIREQLVDEFLLYLAPKMLGQGAGMARFGPLEDLAQAVALEFGAVQPAGPDLRVLARVAGRDRF